MKTKITCVRACQVKGFGIVTPGMEIELESGRIDARIASCFVGADGKPVTPGQPADGQPDLIPKSPEEKAKEDEDAIVNETAKRMSKDQLLQTLGATPGVSFDAKMSKEDLARVLLRARGAIK